MKKHARKVLCILLALCFTSISAFATNAAPDTVMENTVQPRFTYISYASVGLGIEYNGYSTCDTSVTLYESIYDVEIVMTLQRYEDSDWEDVKTWSIIDDGPDADLVKHWYVLSGYDYRVVSDIYVYNTNDQIVEITTQYSPLVEF